MDKITPFWQKLRKSRYLNKYVITLLIFGVIIVFVDENSLLRRLSYTNQENQLRREIRRYRSEYEESTRRLNELALDSNAIERIAREKYLMKRPDEDIYVFQSDLSR